MRFVSFLEPVHTVQFLVSKTRSGLHENGSPLKIVAMEKEVQASIMHKHGFGKRERFANKTSQTLSQRVIPALHMSRFSGFLPDRCMLLFCNHSLVGLPKIGVAAS
jgi:hypothetical protein